MRLKILKLQKQREIATVEGTSKKQKHPRLSKRRKPEAKTDHSLNYEGKVK